MFQLYLFTVLTTVLAGLALAAGYLSRRFAQFSDYTAFMANPIYRVILAIFTLLIAVINLLQTYPGDIAVVGELLPSLAGLATGTLLFAEFLSARKESQESKTAELAGKVKRFSGPYLTIVGISSVVIGVLHAVLPRIPVF